MIAENTYESYLQGLLKGDCQRCDEHVDRLLEEQTATLVLYQDLFRRSLYEVGSLWERNRISVAVEHLSTAITERLLAKVYPRLIADRREIGKSAVVSCGINEYHQVGARMVADVLDAGGWEVRFLGANVPEQDLLQMIDETKPELVGLSLSIYFNMASFVRTVQAVRHHYPDLEILAGGQAFRWGGAGGLGRSCRVVDGADLQALATEIAG